MKSGVEFRSFAKSYHQRSHMRCGGILPPASANVGRCIATASFEIILRRQKFERILIETYGEMKSYCSFCGFEMPTPSFDIHEWTKRIASSTTRMRYYNWRDLFCFWPAAADRYTRKCLELWTKAEELNMHGYTRWCLSSFAALRSYRACYLNNKENRAFHASQLITTGMPIFWAA